MESQPWLNRVRQRLAKHVLPPSYVQRFIEELSDHLDDLKAEGMDQNSSSRLGEPEQVADTAVAAYRRRSFLGRHPTAAFLVFAISPVMSFICLFLLACAALVLLEVVGERMGILSYVVTPVLPVSRYVFSVLTIIISATLVSILYCWIAKRWSVGKAWILASCVVLAGAADLSPWVVHPRLDSSGHYVVPVTLMIPGRCGSYGWDLAITIVQLVQFLVPLAIGWWFLRRKHDQGQLQLAS